MIYFCNDIILIQLFILYRWFLEALDKYERGNWKTFLEYIQTKDTIQVASHALKYFIHALKYFIRQRRSEEQRKRKSIHDMLLEDITRTDIHIQNSSSSETNPVISQFYDEQLS